MAGTGTERTGEAAMPAEWPATKIEMWAISRIRPYEKNARTHPDSQIDLLAASMRDNGVTSPILVDETGEIIYGHARRLAAIKNGFEVYPVVIARGWTNERKRAVRLQDNAVALLSGWDANLIKVELTELKLAGYDIPLLGFPEIQLRGFGFQIGTEGAADPEIAPEPPAKPVSRRGDLWILGDHRLLCGDATSESDVATCLGGARPHLTVTDPPYGVDYDPSWRADANKWKGSIVKLGAKAMGRVQNDTRPDWRDAWALSPSDVIYGWSSSLYALDSAIGLQAAGFVLRSQIIWNKGRLVIGRGDYHWQHEPCWYAVRKGRRGHWQGDRTQSTVWDIAKPQQSETGHGTQKPIECMKRPIENNSKAGDHVYEPFCGSGTTIIAAEMTKRRALAIEISPAYVDVTVLRWQNFTGRLARLQATGQAYGEAKMEREQGNATRNTRKSVPRKNARGNGAKRSVRKGVHDGLAAPRRKPAGEPPPVAGNP